MIFVVGRTQIDESSYPDFVADVRRRRIPDRSMTLPEHGGSPIPEWSARAEIFRLFPGADGDLLQWLDQLREKKNRARRAAELRARRFLASIARVVVPADEPEPLAEPMLVRAVSKSDAVPRPPPERFLIVTPPVLVDRRRAVLGALAAAGV